MLLKIDTGDPVVGHGLRVWVGHSLGAVANRGPWPKFIAGFTCVMGVVSMGVSLLSVCKMVDGWLVLRQVVDYRIIIVFLINTVSDV